MQRTRILTESAASATLSVPLGFLKLWELLQGGAVSLERIPLLVFAYRRGAFSGLLAGAVYGLLFFLFFGAVYHPLSIFLDYILAFMCVGLSGLFPKNIWGISLGSTAAVGTRFLCSFISGAVIFKASAPAGQNPWLYSFCINARILSPSLLSAFS